MDQVERDVIWRVGAILNESLEATLRFVAWYLDLGAKDITLLFDNPKDPAINVLQGVERVRCIACTDAFWSALGKGNEARFAKRQNAAMTWLYRQYDTGWFLNVDADEYLYCGNGGVTDLIARADAESLSIRVETAEALVVEGASGLYRAPMKRAARRAVYGADVGLFRPRRVGLVGHAEGKSLTRCGVENLYLRQHWPQRRGQGRMPETIVRACDGVYLLHEIGLDYETWRQKLNWRVGASGFAKGLALQLQEVLEGDDPEPCLRGLYQKLHCADKALCGGLREHNALLELELDLDRRVARHFGQRFTPLAQPSLVAG